jgi:phytoene dehydrogenase-like protein
MSRPDLDAIVVGAGPNGLTAAARLASLGASVQVIEAAPHIGGGASSAPLMRSSVRNDICSAVHPFGACSPAFAALDLRAQGLEWVQPEIGLAHPVTPTRAAVLDRDDAVTRASLGADARRWDRMARGLDRRFDAIFDAALHPVLRVPRHPVAAARFGLAGLQPMTTFAGRFGDDAAPALLAGLAAHSGLRLDRWWTTAPALLLAATMRRGGWPVARGGSQSIADALAAIVTGAGGTIECGQRVTTLSELPPARSVFLDVSARQLADLGGDRLPVRYRNALLRFRHGVSACKVDYILSAPVPWGPEPARRAGTVHLGGTLLDVAASEATVVAGAIAEQPFVLVGQPTLCDPTRAPGGEQVLWAYCHVPQGRNLEPHLDEIVGFIEARIEAFAPGFRDTIVERHVMGPAALEAHDANLHGGDIAMGAMDARQLFLRPVARIDPYRTPLPDVYLCSAATPPGPGVHGMGGWNAVGSALRHSLRDISI